MASPFVLFQPFLANLFNGQNAPGADSLKLALTNTLPSVGLANFSQIAEIPPGGGYAVGGIPLVVLSSAQVGGVYTLVIQNFTLVATGAAIAPWEWAVIYDFSKGTLIGYADFGSTLSLDTSEVCNFQFDQVNGLIQAASA